MKSYRLFLLTSAFVIGSLLTQAGEPQKVIFETDMGNDIDDVLALDMLYKYQDAKLIDIAFISNNKANSYSVPFIAIMNNFYGYPAIPIIDISQPKVKEGAQKSYVEHVVTGQYDFSAAKRGKKSSTASATKVATSSTSSATVALSTSAPTPLNTVAMYRKTLAESADSSVVVISVGFFTNLAYLLDSKPDEYSALSGAELVARKVKLLSVMGGDFRADRKREFNIRFDIESAQKVFSCWSSPILVSPWEVGAEVMFECATLDRIAYAKLHPLKVAYAAYLPMPYDRQTWDLTSVLVAVNNPHTYFNTSARGTVSVSNDGKTFFTTASEGNCSYLIVDQLKKKAASDKIIDLLIQEPAKR